MNTTEVQRALIARGYDLGKSGADGDFGALTLAAVKAFQKANRLPVGATVPAETIAALCTPVSKPASAQTMSAIGREALIAREGVRLTAYLDSVGVWTIGIGHTAMAGDPAPKKGMTITMEDAHAIFARDMVKYEQAVMDAVKVPLADHQFDALVSICFNIGTGALAGSTFVKRINAGATPAAIRTAILMWNKPAEIVSRRTAEADQFATPYSVAMPKARSTDAARVKV
ncbi:glycoside hydrolase family protein [Camelimonas fluminis]|uniref:Lysozyme n=1 Tax=Camelimonas fluminis TaxID=1576911 RepID=A0ABV7UI80_9HYPH|nr:glycoside hydrolase family protein [Camelimonas fluminis]